MMSLTATTDLQRQRDHLARYGAKQYRRIVGTPAKPSVEADIVEKMPHFAHPYVLLAESGNDLSPKPDLFLPTTDAGVYTLQPTLYAWPCVMPTYDGVPLSDLPQCKARAGTPVYLVARWILVPATATLSVQLGCESARLELREPLPSEANDNSAVTGRTTRTWWHRIGSFTATGFQPSAFISPYYPPSWQPY